MGKHASDDVSHTEQMDCHWVGPIVGRPSGEVTLQLNLASGKEEPGAVLIHLSVERKQELLTQLRAFDEDFDPTDEQLRVNYDAVPANERYRTDQELHRELHERN
jgi:hypothetical protein